MRFLILTAIMMFTLASLPAISTAVIYKYVDETGRTFYVGDEDQIPPQYRQQTDAIKEERDTMTQEEFEALEAERAQRIEDLEVEQQARQQARLQEKRRAYQTPVMIRGNRIMVPVEVAMGSDVSHLFLLLDTGASATVLHRGSLSGLDLPAGEKVQARVAGGRTLPSEKIKFKYIEIGPFREHSTHAIVIDSQGPPLPFDGMLGMDFLKTHPYRIDFDGEMLIWEDQ